MSITMFQIKRWIKMLSGKSIEHVNQDIGKCFDSHEIRGYYNNFTEKVTKNSTSIEGDDLPTLITESGEEILFPVAIFQYGLGAYDLWLQSDDERYLKKFFVCADWALNNIDKKGRWNNFFFYRPETPYGAMAQGEGASLLIRAYLISHDEKYLKEAKNAIDFMLLPLEKGGTTKYEDNNAFLMEYTFKGMVLNGAIFAWWGLYDFVKVTNDQGLYRDLLQKTLNSIIFILPEFRGKLWSNYSLDGLIASPFYHNLHIAQMDAMYQLTRQPVFKNYMELWRRRRGNPILKSLAFIKKAYQKLME